MHLQDFETFLLREMPLTHTAFQCHDMVNCSADFIRSNISTL